MALKRDYNIPNTSFVIEDAYHIVTNVEVKKRNIEDPGPVPTTEPVNIAPPIYNEVPHERPMTDEDKAKQHPINYIPTGSFEVDREADGVYWETGYTAQIHVEIYADKNARDTGKNPIGKLGISTSTISPQVATKGMDGKIMFKVNHTSEDNILSQAYTYLKSTDYYSSSLDI